MKTIHLSSLLGMLLFLAACVTINVYFPAAEMESAAEKIVNEALKDDEGTDGNDQSFYQPAVPVR